LCNSLTSVGYDHLVGPWNTDEHYQSQKRFVGIGIWRWELLLLLKMLQTS
jgi:hypothetical protein